MIQSPKELSAALQRLLVRAGDENPSRLKLAQELRVLATQLEPQVKTGASTKVPLAQTRKLIEQAYSVGQASHSSVIREDVQKYIRQVEGLIRIPGPPSGALVSAILDVFWAYGVLSKDEDADGNGYNAQSSSDGRREASSKAKTDARPRTGWFKHQPPVPWDRFFRVEKELTLGYGSSVNRPTPPLYKTLKVGELLRLDGEAANGAVWFIDAEGGRGKVDAGEVRNLTRDGRLAEVPTPPPK
jgi:hypothetical protein